jgi:hypothetical protein
MINLLTLREQHIFVNMKKEIIETAINNLCKNTGVQGQFIFDNVLDGILRLHIDDKATDFVILVKKEIRRHQLFELMHYKQLFTNFIVIAEDIFPMIREELREMGIAYLEVNGNVYIKKAGVFLFIDSNKKAVTIKKTANRAFTKTGLRVLFHLLNDKQLINKTQREIADIVRVGLGNIPQVIHGLKEMGYLIQYSKQEFVWENRKELFDRWINEYATQLRPKLIKGNFTLKKDWQKIDLNNQHSVWGGEAAADKLTNNLRPEKFILYTDEKQNDLIKNYHIVPQINGELEVLEIFWTSTKDIAPPLIVYAELMLSGGKRNKEIAKKIYDEYIKPIL